MGRRFEMGGYGTRWNGGDGDCKPDCMRLVERGGGIVDGDCKPDCMQLVEGGGIGDGDCNPDCIRLVESGFTGRASCFVVRLFVCMRAQDAM